MAPTTPDAQGTPEIVTSLTLSKPTLSRGDSSTLTYAQGTPEIVTSLDTLQTHACAVEIVQPSRFIQTEHQHKLNLPA
jgi:hypothetical protein